MTNHAVGKAVSLQTDDKSLSGTVWQASDHELVLQFLLAMPWPHAGTLTFWDGRVMPIQFDQAKPQVHLTLRIPRGVPVAKRVEADHELGPTGKEHRRAVRTGLNVKMWLADPATLEKRWLGSSLEASVGGVSVETDAPIQIGQAYLLGFAFSGLEMLMLGKAIRKSGSQSIAFRFTTDEDFNRRFMRLVWRQIRGTPTVRREPLKSFRR